MLIIQVFLSCIERMESFVLIKRKHLVFFCSTLIGVICFDRSFVLYRMSGQNYFCVFFHSSIFHIRIQKRLSFVYNYLLLSIRNKKQLMLWFCFTIAYWTHRKYNSFCIISFEGVLAVIKCSFSCLPYSLDLCIPYRLSLLP